MEAIAISAALRTETGKGANRKLRAAGRIPAVLYGHNVDAAISLSLDPSALAKALENPKGYNALFQIDVEGSDSHTVLVRALQREPVSRKVLHVDLICPDLTKLQQSTVPVEILGKAPGIALGGLLLTLRRDIAIESLPANIPISITIDVSGLGLEESVSSTALNLSDGVTLVDEDEFVVVKVVRPRGTDDEAAEEAEGESEGSDDASGEAAATDAGDE